MSEYQNIQLIFKESRQKTRVQLIQQRLARFRSQKQQLNDLLDFQKIEKIQQSVDERMGPQLCDNSEQESKQHQQSFLTILEDYQRQISLSSKQEKECRSKLISVVEEQLKAVSSEFISLKKQVSKKIQETKKNRDEITLFSQEIDQLNAQELEKEVKAMEHEIEIRILEHQLAQRKRVANIVSIISSISLIH